MLKLSAILLIMVVTTMFFNACNMANASAVAIPNPKLDAPLATTTGEQTAVFAGGCFWGVEAVFDRVKGVSKAESGYSGGGKRSATLTILGFNHWPVRGNHIKKKKSAAGFAAHNRTDWAGTPKGVSGARAIRTKDHRTDPR